jgi:integrase
VFLRADGGVWGTSHQKRPLDEASKRAGISPAVNFHILRHTHGSHLAMSGVPMGVVAAQLGHADTRMTGGRASQIDLETRKLRTPGPASQV